LVRGAALDAQGQAAPLSEARAPAFRPASRLRGPGDGRHERVSELVSESVPCHGPCRPGSARAEAGERH
jgi:hypothetical protein